MPTHGLNNCQHSGERQARLRGLDQSQKELIIAHLGRTPPSYIESESTHTILRRVRRLMRTFGRGSHHFSCIPQRPGGPTPDMPVQGRPAGTICVDSEPAGLAWENPT
jgi:hypothetical protein